MSCRTGSFLGYSALVSEVSFLPNVLFAAFQSVLKASLIGNAADTGKLEATCNALTAADKHAEPDLSLPVDGAPRDLASSMKMQPALPQKLTEQISVGPQHTDQKSWTAPNPITGLTSADTEPTVDTELLNVAKALQPIAPSLELHISEGLIAGVRNDKVAHQESNRDDIKREKREEPIKKLSELVKTLDASPIPYTPTSLPVIPVHAIAADGSSPDRSSCQQECTLSPFRAPPKMISMSLNEHDSRPDWHETGGLNQLESQPSYVTTGDEWTRMTSATLVESEEVNAWDEDSWDEAEKVEDAQESLEKPESRPSVVTDGALSSISCVPTPSGQIEPSGHGTDQNSKTRNSCKRILDDILVGTLGQQHSRTVELETAVPSGSSSYKDYATKALPVHCAVDVKEQNQPTHPAGDPAPDLIALSALSLNSKCEANYLEPSAQQVNLSVEGKHDLETATGSTIGILHKTSTASQASDEAEGWDLSCVSVLSSLPQPLKSSPGKQSKDESNYSVAFKQALTDWDADWINEEEEEVKVEEEKEIKTPPDLTTTGQKKDTLPKHCEGGTRLEKTNDDWDFDEWDCADKTPAVAATKVPPQPSAHSLIAHETTDSAKDASILPEYLSTAATSLVKTVGGGLASFVDNFSLAHLSATLAAFDAAPPSAQQPPCTDSFQDDVKPQNETETKEAVFRGPVETEAKAVVDDDSWGLAGISWSSFAKSLSSTVENRGMQLLQGGVDVLETIGKKTFTALKETDPGLSYTKKFLLAPQSNQTTRLSQVLREASRQTQENLSEGPTRGNEGNTQDQRGDFAYQLEIRHALVHMEALELVSSRASAHLHAKITSLENREFPRGTTKGEDMSISSLTNEGGILDKIWQTLQTVESQAEEEDDAVENIMDNLNLLDAICPAAAIQQKCKQLREKSKESTDTSSATDVFCVAIDSLAEATTAMLTYLHKLAECLLARPEKVQDGFLNLAQKVTLIIQTGKKYNESLCSDYVEVLKKNERESARQMVFPSVSDEVTPPISSKRHMANLFLETGAANDYLSSSCGCFVPIIQLLCVNSFFPNDPS
uniref:Protein Noxp20 n=1 Tax=Schistocephalus solidus TaxID=70667 RepID=A0A0X3PNJ0_SCHSO